MYEFVTIGKTSIEIYFKFADSRAGKKASTEKERKYIKNRNCLNENKLNIIFI